jgi:hypothetical protein
MRGNPHVRFWSGGGGSDPAVDHIKEYGVTLTEANAFCSCPDALYRGSICKHVTTLALAVLRGEVKGVKSTRTIHLVSQESITLCGVQNAPNVWSWPYWPEKAWKESCPECEKIRRQPVFTKTSTAVA